MFACKLLGTGIYKPLGCWVLDKEHPQTLAWSQYHPIGDSPAASGAEYQAHEAMLCSLQHLAQIFAKSANLSDYFFELPPHMHPC